MSATGVAAGGRVSCVWVGLLPRKLEIACIDPHQTEPVGKGSDHLQLTKFWPSRALERGLRLGENWDPLITFERKELSASNLVQT